MPPSAIIDSALGPGGVLYVIESGVIWRSTDIKTAGAATWTQLMLALESAIFHRIAVGGGNVYVLATKPNGANNDALLYASTNGGQTFTVYPIAASIGEGKPYKIGTTGLTEISGSGGDVATAPIDARWDGTETYNPWAIAVRVTRDNVQTISLDDSADADYVHTMGGGNFGVSQVDRASVWINNKLTAGEQTTAKAWVTELYGVKDAAGAWQLIGTAVADNLPKGAARIQVAFKFGGTGSWNAHQTTNVFFKYPAQLELTALACAPSNSRWVYVGTPDAILKSENGGQTWVTLTDAYGANDIAVHPTAAGVVTFWSTAGTLHQMIVDQVQASQMSETALAVPHRIAYDKQGGSKLWVLANTGAGCDLHQWYQGAWTSKQTGITGGTGLNAYRHTGGVHKLVYIGDGHVYYSENDGTTVADKIGDWTGLAGAVNVELL